MKKRGSILISVLLVSLLAINLVAAQGFAEGFTGFIDGFKDALRPIFETLFGAAAGGGELATQILVFLLVVFIIYGVLDVSGLFGRRTWVNIAIGVIVAILGIRFLPSGFLQGLTTPASALVAILVMGIPFLILFLIIERTEKMNSVVRRIIWVAYAVLVFVLWVYNFTNPNIPTTAKAIYPLILIACLLAFAFDGTLQKLFRGAKIAREVEATENVELQRAIARLDDLKQRLGRATNEEQRTQITDQIKAQKEALKALKNS